MVQETSVKTWTFVVEDTHPKVAPQKAKQQVAQKDSGIKYADLSARLVNATGVGDTYVVVDVNDLLEFGITDTE